MSSLTFTQMLSFQLITGWYSIDDKYNTPDCMVQMYVPFDKTAPSFAPVFEKLKLAPSILGVAFLPVSNTLTY